MDPLFERRNLNKKVQITGKWLQKNMEPSILAKLKQAYEGECSAEGYIQKNSITIINYSLGRANFNGTITYDVEFQADICLPHIGQKFRAPVTLRSKIGIHAETSPIKVLIPRDLHIGNEDFDNIKVDEEIEFEVMGSQFKQKDTEIIVIGRLLSKIPEPVQQPLLVAPAVEEIQLPTAVTKTDETEEKKIVITAPITPDKPVKRRLRRGGGELNNGEQFPSFKERMVEGTT